ncbi:MAG: hypothetical protein AAF937_02725 [Planctomycetota bacterium]
MSAADRVPLRVSGLDNARDAVVQRLRLACLSRPIIGITGPVGSGKSTLAQRICGTVGGLVISTDRYLPDYERVPAADRDLPEHSDLDRLAADLAELADSGRATIPRWSFHEHRRVGEDGVTATGPIICEGIFALHDTVARGISVGVFVDAAPSTRWQRWEAIETSGARGWGVETARTHFETVAEPTFRRFEAEYRRHADIVVFNEDDRGSREP